MKKIILITGIVIAFTAFTRSANAQVNVHVNIGSQPTWGPAGYDYVDYYYLPDIESYYYVPRHQFVYMSNGRWIYSRSLPSRYRGYDLYSGYKVVVNEPRPYLRFEEHRMRYAPYRGNRTQVVIRDRHDNGRHNGWQKHGRRW
jgi:hypothetical protein